MPSVSLLISILYGKVSLAGKLLIQVFELSK
jgi:hypothetical protein